MSREVDRRVYKTVKVSPRRERELNALASVLSGELPGAHRIRITRFDARTGNPAAVASEHTLAETSNYVQRALDHTRRISRALGFAPTQTVEFVADPNYQKTSSGAVAVHLQQCYKGIPIFEAAETVRFAPNGTLKETSGTSVSSGQEIAVSPALSVYEAVLKAAQHVATPDDDEQHAKDEFGEPLKPAVAELTNFEPKVISSYPEKPERPTMFEAGPFGDSIKANLLWFDLDDQLKLIWEVILTMPNFTGQYRTFVDTENGQVLYCRQLMQFIAARGNVFHVDGGGMREMTDFPRPLTDYGLPIPNDIPSEFPSDWVNEDSTVGNNVDAQVGDNGPSAQGSVQNGVVTFDPSDPTGDDQKVLNIFYYNCFMHDYFYLLGFQEADGNFQRDNFGRGGLASDRVDARAHSGVVQGTANMLTPMDGSNPLMNMGLVASTSRHTAFDSSVVFHEFTHGVTNRLVGGPGNAFALEEHQSGGMGEGWGDYFACTINETTVVGDWVVNNPRGIRDFPYDSDFPDNFGDLGTGRYTGFLPDGRRSPHPIGEIWCATLLEMNRNIGANLGAQLVVDALKLMPANPSFLDARNAILAALDDMFATGQLGAGDHEIARNGIWQAFARFGMGPNAESNGASLSGIVADFDTPTEKPEQPEPDVRVEATPNLDIPDNQPTGIDSVLNVPQAGHVTRLVVSVDITHTYIGDLQVSLITPAGFSVRLHNRNGGSANNLVQSYGSDNVAALAAVLGESAQGDWTMHVVDLAGQDVGALNHWRLEINLEAPGQSVQSEVAPALSIPDNNSNGVTSSINIGQPGTMRNIKISVDITHTFIGDLRVELIAPSGQQALLHDQFGGSADNLITTYDSISNLALEDLVGQAIQGEWVLRVADLVGQDIGKLNKWRLELSF